MQSPTGDPKKTRVFVVVSRDALIRSRFSTVVCAPVLTTGEGLSTQVEVGPADGLKHRSWIRCDALTSIERSKLIDVVSALSTSRLRDLNRALRIALDV